MIHPSYSELIDAINAKSEEYEEDVILNSRYSLVLAASKRARQLIDGARPLVPNARDKKPLSVAIDELYKGKVRILGKKEDDELLLTSEGTEEIISVSEDVIPEETGAVPAPDDAFGSPEAVSGEEAGGEQADPGSDA